MSDILFVHTNASATIYQALSKKHSAIEPPIWAGMLANSIRAIGHSADILDCEVLQLSHQDAVKAIIDINPKLVCFVVYGQQPSASTQNMSGASTCSKLLRDTDPRFKIVFVGGHVAALPRAVMLQEPQVDFVCQNEGVYTLRDLVRIADSNFNSKDLEKINGLGWRDKDHRVILNPQSEIVPKNRLEIDLPGVAWDLLPPLSKYRTAGWHSWSNDSEKQPFGALYTSLGCPYKCSFCMINIINKTGGEEATAADSALFRWWNPEFIIKQFDFFASQNVKNIKIADELFVLNPHHFESICDLIIERKYNFNIWAYSRIDTCKPKYLDKLKAAGVNWLGLGIENPSQVLRREIHKDGFKDVKITDVISSIREAGINVGGNYIFGLPMDTHESMQQTLDFAMSNKTEMVNFYCAMAYPGSPLYKQALAENWELPSSYSGYSQHSYDMLNLRNANLTSADICRFRDDAWMKYNSDAAYLVLLESRFGKAAMKDIEDTCTITLKRKLLGD